MAQVVKGVSVWVEPMREWIKDAQNMGEIVISSTVSLKKSSAQKIFGTNPSLINQKIQFTAIKPYDALRASREKNSENEFCTLFSAVFLN